MDTFEILITIWITPESSGSSIISHDQARSKFDLREFQHSSQTRPRPLTVQAADWNTQCLNYKNAETQASKTMRAPRTPLTDQAGQSLYNDNMALDPFLASCRRMSELDSLYISHPQPNPHTYLPPQTCTCTHRLWYDEHSATMCTDACKGQPSSSA